jgi:hypothetical protein
MGTEIRHTQISAGGRETVEAGGRQPHQKLITPAWAWIVKRKPPGFLQTNHMKN